MKMENKQIKPYKRQNSVTRWFVLLLCCFSTVN